MYSFTNNFTQIRVPDTFQKPSKIGDESFWDRIRLINSISAATVVTPKNDGKLIKIGSNGEILIASETTIQVWDWIKPAIQIRELEATSEISPSLNEETPETSQTENLCLYLVSSSGEIVHAPKDIIIDFHPIEIKQDRNYYRVMVISQNSATQKVSAFIHEFGQLFPESTSVPSTRTLKILSSTREDNRFTIKTTRRFICICSSDGTLSIFDEEKDFLLQLEVCVKIENMQPLFDIVGNKLLHVPTESDKSKTESMRVVVPESGASSSKRFLNNLGDISFKSMATIVKMKNSNTSEIKKSLLDLVSESTRSNNEKDTNRTTKNYSVHIFDLESNCEIARFTPLKGISLLSICPYNTCIIITVSKEGDAVYRWDITKAPKLVQLLDIGITGRASSVMSQVTWSSANNVQLLTRTFTSVINIDFLDSNKNWILPGSQFSKMLPISLNTEQALLIIAASDTIYLIDRETGVLISQFQLPENLVPITSLPNYIPLYPSEEIIVRETVMTSQNMHSNPSKLSILENSTYNQTPILMRELDIKPELSHQKDKNLFWNQYKLKDIKEYFEEKCGHGDEMVEAIQTKPLYSELANAIDGLD